MKIRSVSMLAAIAMLATSCFYTSALQSQSDSPATSPWWCTATASWPASNSGSAYTGLTKGPLSDADCEQVSAQFDIVNGAIEVANLTSAGDAAASSIELSPYEPGVGSSFAGFDPAELTSPAFDPDDPVFTQVPGFPGGIDGTFRVDRPELLHYGGDGADDRLVGVTWMVRTDATTPPAGFDGDNDWWHREVDEWCLSVATGERLGVGMGDTACTNAGGINLNLSRYWFLDAWIAPGMAFQTDVFAEWHPCLQAGGAIFDPAAPCHVRDNPEIMRVLVTNDDGYDSEGLDDLVEGLLEVPDLEVFVYAPREQKSGSGDRYTVGSTPPVALLTTLSGYPVRAIGAAGVPNEGYPADAVLAGLGDLTGADTPHLIVSGNNEGPNIGPFAGVSGTVGGAKTAARQGIPAVAVSQDSRSLDPAPPDYPAGTKAVVDWIRDNRADIMSGALSGSPAQVVSINVPSCPVGSVRGVASPMPLAPDLSAGNPFIDPVDCTSTLTNPANDNEAMYAGFVSVGPIVGNDTPVPIDDTGATTNAAPLTVGAAGVLANDRDGAGSFVGPDFGDSFTVTAFDAVSVLGATVVVNGDGSYTYDPATSATLEGLATGAQASDTFTYTVTDSFGAFATGTVTITVTGA